MQARTEMLPQLDIFKRLGVGIRKWVGAHTVGTWELPLRPHRPSQLLARVLWSYGVSMVTASQQPKEAEQDISHSSDQYMHCTELPRLKVKDVSHRGEVLVSTHIRQWRCC